MNWAPRRSFQCLVERQEVVAFQVHRVEGVDPVLLRGVDAQPRQGRHLHPAQDDAVVAPRGAGLLRHEDEVVLVPGLDLPEIAGEVLDDVDLAAGGDALERVRGHPVVNGVDVGLVDQLPVALHQEVILVPERGVGLAQDGVPLLAGLEKQRPVLVVRRVERRRAVEGRAEPEDVEEPAGLVAEPAPERPGLVLAAVFGIFPVEVVAPPMQLQVGVPQEGREVLHRLPGRSEETLDRRRGRRRRRIVGGRRPDRCQRGDTGAPARGRHAEAKSPP